jgi:uncharacterized protein GlcG (DUF336 family)
MDDAALGSLLVPQLKVETSSKFEYAICDIGERVYGKDNKGGILPGFVMIPDIVVFAGGLPIKIAGRVLIGGIGVGGSTPGQDEARAQTGPDAANDMLK